MSGNHVTGILGPGHRLVGLVAKNSLDYVRRFFGYLSNGVVVVPLQSRDDRYRIEVCGITEIVEPADDHGWMEDRREFGWSHDIAQIAFTSGTEGQPKGVLLTHANLTSTVERIREKMSLDDSIREYVGIPVFHSFGFGRCRVIASLGGKCYIPETGFSLNEIRALLRSGEINAISTVPTLWKVLLQHKQLFVGLGERVRWIEIGSQPMERDDKAELRAVFPRARIVQHYGLTEASRSTFLDIGAASQSELDSVGTPNGDVEIDITEAGGIRIRGENVARELLVGGKRVANVDDDGWLSTSDMGEIRDGNLFFTGRADDVINLGGKKLSAVSIERGVQARLDDPDGVCVVRIPDPARGDGILVAARSDLALGDEKLLDIAGAAVAELGVDAASSIRTMRVTEFPVTALGKIRRHVLSEQYALAAAESRAGSASGGPAGDEQHEAARPAGRDRAPPGIRSVYERVFPGKTIGASDSFVSLNGDSLNFVEVSIALEDLLGRLPDDWPNLTIEKLESLHGRKTRLHPVDTTLMLRCVGIIAIVAGHFTQLQIGGATYLLLAVSGFNFSRFQIPNVLATGSIVPILSTAARFALPLLLVVFAIQTRHGEYHLKNLALVSNWETVSLRGLDFWFLELILQIFAVSAALFLVPFVRARFARNAGSATLVFLFICVAAALLVPLAWNADHLHNHVPHMLMWLFVLGWALQQATTVSQKLFATVLVVALPLLLWGIPTQGAPGWIGWGHLWLALGGLALLYAKTIVVPYPLNKLVYWVGGASMFIYIVHAPFRAIWHRFTDMSNPYLDVLVAIVVGVVAYSVWERLTRQVVRVFARRRLKAAPAQRPS